MMLMQSIGTEPTMMVQEEDRHIHILESAERLYSQGVGKRQVKDTIRLYLTFTDPRMEEEYREQLVDELYTVFEEANSNEETTYIGHIIV